VVFYLKIYLLKVLGKDHGYVALRRLQYLHHLRMLRVRGRLLRSWYLVDHVWWLLLNDQVMWGRRVRMLEHWRLCLSCSRLPILELN